MKNLQETYIEEFEVHSYENDFRQRLRLATLFQFFQEVAGRHVAGTPIGYEALKEIGCFWVLVRIKVRIHRMPNWRERITLKTWAKKIDKMFAYRECEVTNETGLLASISSEWMLMDQKKRKPVRLSVLPTQFPIHDGGSTHDDLNKIKPFGSPVIQETRSARYSDMDMHSHVNNTKYIEWILDLIPYEAMKAKEIDGLQVSFASEVNFGDEIHIMGAVEGEDRYYFEGYNRTKDIKAFQLEIKMR